MMMALRGRRGSALLIVLGMLSFMVVSAMGFSMYMRASRAPSSYLRRNVAARYLVKAALAKAIGELEGDVNRDSNWGTVNKLYGIYDDPERGRGWRGGWNCAEETVPFLSLVDDVPPGARGKALRMTVEGEPRIVHVENVFSSFNGKYEPGRRYRVSFFVRLTDVVSHGNGGVGVRVWHDRNEWFPRNRITGTTGWIHQEYFFTAGAKSADFDSQFAIHLWNATGTVDWADLRLEPCD